jgi:hypothetical protein
MLVTTQLMPGVEVLLGSIKFGRMAVREPLSVRVGFANDDLVRNIYRSANSGLRWQWSIRRRT